MDITINQKRFLIVWILIHSFALFVNLAHIKGEYYNKVYQLGGENREIKYLFTNSINQDQFWPFTDYTTNTFKKDTVGITPTDNDFNIISLRTTSTEYFNGVFNSYNFPEFIFYILIGFAIVFVPKLWSNTQPST